MLTSYCIQLVAVILLSLSMLKHYRDAFARPLPTKVAKLLKLIGGLLLILSFYCVISTEYPALNSVYWLCFLSLNIGGVAFIHSKLGRK